MRTQSSDPFPASQNRSLKDVDRIHATSADDEASERTPNPEIENVMLITSQGTDCPAKRIRVMTLRIRPSFGGNTEFPAGAGFPTRENVLLVPTGTQMRGVSPTHGLATD
ncbi:hypothetical protein GCM10027590_12850 [Nocardiopsis nanhaiensis]